MQGEMWEVTSGAVWKRFFRPTYFDDILKKNEGKTSLSTEEIEKDLNRSLPEYPAYQTDEGINSLRRVLYVIHLRYLITIGLLLSRSSCWLLSSNEYRC